MVVYVHRLYQKEEEYSDLLTKGPSYRSFVAESLKQAR